MKKRAADRILVTEVARGQSIAAIESFKEADIDKYIWISEPSACDVCAELNDKVFTLGAANNIMPPETHPFCRCAISAYVE